MSIKNLTLPSHQELKEVLSVLERYDVAAVGTNIFRNTIGFVNKTFVIEAGNKKFVLRESSLATVPEHLELEVEVLGFLEEKSYKLSPRLLTNKHGHYITYHNDRFYTLQTFVPGEIKASWNDLEHLTSCMLESFFRCSAEFTKTVQGFKPRREYANLPLTHYVKHGRKLLKSFLEKLPVSEGKKLLAECLPQLLHFSEQTNKELVKINYDVFPKQLVHFDLHPGNVHFVGEEVVGLFDFDWVRFDFRISDLAATIGQSCYIFGGEKSGLYIKEKVSAGLEAYREAYGQSEFDERKENHFIKVALKGYMFFQLLWVVDWYRENCKSPDGVFNLRHFINTCLLNDYEKLFS